MAQSESSAQLVIKNLNEFRRELEQINDFRKSAGITATKVEAFRLRDILKREIRQGGAGGRKFEPLQTISKTPPSSRRKPLARLANGIRYKVSSRGADTLVSFGFTGSKSWQRIATLQQDGGVVDPDSSSRSLGGKSLRAKFRESGGGYKKNKKYPRLTKYFFLRKQTSSLRIPRREIIAPFWQQHSASATKNIMDNFERKMRGERI